MPDTADQARQLADLFSQMAATVDAYRAHNFKQLSLDDRERLEQLIQQLYDIHDSFTSIAIQRTLDAIGKDLSEIAHVTKDAEESLRHLNTVAHIVKIVAAAAELAQDIFTADYGAIPLGIKNLAQAIPKTADKNPSGTDLTGTERPN